jgi:hypothetical protein
MSKVKDMATEQQCQILSKNIRVLKEKLGTTYRDMNSMIGRPCNASTLQIRASYPNGVRCSLKLHNKIEEAINKFEKNSTEDLKEKEIIESLRNSAIADIDLILKSYSEKIKEYYKKKNKY